MSKFFNKTRTSKSISKKLLKEGKFYLLPIYLFLLTSKLGKEGITNSGSYTFADHIYENKPKGKYFIGYIVDAILLKLKSAKSFRFRFLFARDQIYKYLNVHGNLNKKIDILAVPSGLARELFEAAEHIKTLPRYNLSKIQFHGLDLNPDLVKFLSARAEGDNLPMSFWTGDALNGVDFKGNYDIIISMGFCEFINDEQALSFYKICLSHLKEDGIFITSGMMPHKFSEYLMKNIAELHTVYRSKDKLIKLLSEAGFKNTETYQDIHKLQTMIIGKNMHALKEIENKILGRFNLDQIDIEKAKKNTRHLDLLREVCLIEAYFTEYTSKMTKLFSYDIDATSIFTIEASEAFRHYLGTRRYLEKVGYNPVTDAEIIALRQKDKDVVYNDEIRELVNFMMTEHFAAHFFADLAEETEEPVLKVMLPIFSQEEIVHSQFAFDLLEARLKKDPSIKDSILEHAQHFVHIGAYVLPFVSTVKEDNIKTINTFNHKIEDLVGMKLSDYVANK